MKRTFGIWIIVLIATGLITLLYGPLSWEELWTGQGGWHPVLDHRLPRFIVLMATGASLAVSGAIMQALFQNPLASPSVLGISFGGSLLVVVVSALNLHLETPYAIPIAAFTGCVLTMLLVYSLARRRDGTSLPILILTGIAISTLLLAIQSAILYALKDRWQLILSLTEWEAGSTHNLSWKQVHMQVPLTIVGLFGALYYRKTLNILALGDDEAYSLGIDVKRVRFRLILCVALLTGGSLAGLGNIAFFGLILPHVIRNAITLDNYYLIPLALLMGATTLPLFDILLRLFEIYTFTIGNVSAILGGAFFLILLFQNKNRYAYH